MRMITNSAGLSGANFTSMFTRPAFTSDGGLSSASTFTANACYGVAPASAPLRNSPIMKSSMFALSESHSGWSFGSKTAYCVPW